RKLAAALAAYHHRTNLFDLYPRVPCFYRLTNLNFVGFLVHLEGVMQISHLVRKLFRHNWPDENLSCHCSTRLDFNSMTFIAPALRLWIRFNRGALTEHGRQCVQRAFLKYQHLCTDHVER